MHGVCYLDGDNGISVFENDYQVIKNVSKSRFDVDCTPLCELNRMHDNSRHLRVQIDLVIVFSSILKCYSFFSYIHI